ncbi:Primosomal protein N' (replication factor Y) - superfamily II helicase-like protein [Rhodobacter ferrooxidans]|uniref:Primosomal protein N' (Replication factor Y)-superfamily II helicase-like protein n=1 Tax=Rhodobacter ferrooxidans TaxID=371731 RepID=C8S3L1_9RHOB|nr:Primosomal protein N' (replication factor Y) - superfamily II helicase-like protein [Rhodobacter sp. SW2]
MQGGQFATGDEVGVLLAETLGRALGPLLDYRAPEGGCALGDFVEVPLGPRRVLGVVWGPGSGGYDPAKLRAVTRVLDAAPMRDEMRGFLARAADYTMTPLSAMLRLATRAPGLGDPPSMKRIYRQGDGVARATDTRARVLEVLARYGGAGLTLVELAAEAGVTTGVIKGLVKAGAVLEEDAPPRSALSGAGPFGVGAAGGRSGHGGRCAGGGGGLGRLWHHLAARRDRLGQDRGLP